MIRHTVYAGALCLLTGAALAQDVVTETADGALLRTLDKVSGDVGNVEIRSGDSFVFGSLVVSLRECRFPVDNPVGEAFAKIEVDDTRLGEQIFSGWMVASSPALIALDHPRYDVWAMRCLSDAEDAG